MRPDPKLDDPGGGHQTYDEPACNGGQQQRDTQRQMPVDAEEADLDPLGVLEDEDQQQEENDRAGDDAGPGAARAGSAAGRLERRRLFLDGRLLLGRGRLRF